MTGECEGGRVLQYSEAEHHCEQSLMFARLIKDERRMTEEYEALHVFAQVRQLQSRLREAVEFAEKSYIVVSEAFGPMHPEVQDVSQMLIQYLIESEDYSRADDYCRMNLENFLDPRNGIDQDWFVIAQAMFQLVRLWLLKDTVDDEKAAFALAEEAEDMIRKAYNMIVKLHGLDALELQVYCSEFADVLMKRCKCTEETRSMATRSLALYRLHPKSFLSTLMGDLDRLVHFHHHMSGTLPPRDARNRELQLRDVYKREFDLLSGR